MRKSLYLINDTTTILKYCKLRKAAVLKFFWKRSADIFVGLFACQVFKNTASCKTNRLNYSASFVIYTFVFVCLSVYIYILYMCVCVCVCVCVKQYII